MNWSADWVPLLGQFFYGNKFLKLVNKNIIRIIIYGIKAKRRSRVTFSVESKYDSHLIMIIDYYFLISEPWREAWGSWTFSFILEIQRAIHATCKLLLLYIFKHQSTTSIVAILAPTLTLHIATSMKMIIWERK